MFNNLERLHQRAKKRNPGIPDLAGYRSQTVTRTYLLSASDTLSQQPIDFPAGSIIVSVVMDASKHAAAADSVRGDLSLVRVAFDLPSADGTLTSGGPVRASALFGRTGDRQWPEQEVVMPRQGSISLTLVNLSPDQVDVDIAFNVLFPRGGS